MSTKNMDDPGLSPDAVRAVGQTVTQETQFGASILRVHGWRLLLVFLGLLLPLWGFGALVETLHEGQVFPFDVPLLQAVHAMANAGLDRAFLLISKLGYAWGVVPFDAVLVLALLLRRHVREGVFAALAIVGSLLLNVAAKHSFARVRPDLWQSVAQAETTYSFPSGHAMGSMTLAMVLVLLCWSMRTPWGSKWRWPVTALATTFVLLVGLSRVYLGLHYPSDILAGWAAALVWVVGVYGLVFYGTLRPWQAKQTGSNPVIPPVLPPR
jgi:membrane-associated phospholipid phosphatase